MSHHVYDLLENTPYLLRWDPVLFSNHLFANLALIFKDIGVPDFGLECEFWHFEWVICRELYYEQKVSLFKGGRSWS